MPSVEDEPIAKISFGRPTLTFGNATGAPLDSKAAILPGHDASSAWAALRAKRMQTAPARRANALAVRQERRRRRELFCTRSNRRQRTGQGWTQPCTRVRRTVQPLQTRAVKRPLTRPDRRR